MLETSTRLLRLLALLQTRTDWTGPQLADRLEVTTRTIRNDIDRLRRVNVLRAEGVNVAGIRLVLDLQDENAGLRDAAGPGADPDGARSD